MDERPDKRGILIADGRSGPAGRLAEALEAEGLGVQIARHGVEALELALSSAPRVVVAVHGLPLVDAPRLAELLQSNPRTSDARFLFLGEPEQSDFEPALGDVQLPATLRPDAIVEALADLLDKQDRLARLDAACDKGEAGRGTLDHLTPGDLVQLLHQGGKSGILELLHEDASGREERGSVSVRAGEVVAAMTGSAQGEKALYRMLTWRSGQYRFGPCRNDDPPQIRVPTRALLAEGLRQRSEWKRMAMRLPPLDSRISLRIRAGALPAGVHPLTQEVLDLLERSESVGDVVENCTFPDYQVLRTLHTLAERGIVSVGRSVAAERRAEAGLFGEVQVRRLREWARESQGRPRSPADLKLVVVASDPAGIADLANLLRPVPGVSLSAELERGSVGADDLMSLGRLRVDDELGIDLVHLPSVMRFEAFWPLACHGALGVILLLSGAVGEALERLQPMVQALREVPRARVFHVVLLGKGDRLAANTLRENLSLIDEASLFLIPLGSEKDPARLLASAFSRIVP